MSKESPWLDIFPDTAWDLYVTQFSGGEKSFNDHVTIKSLLHSIKLGKRSGHNEFLKEVGNLIRGYHKMPKTDVGTLTVRAALLDQLANKVERYLRDLGISPENRLPKKHHNSNSTGRVTSSTEKASHHSVAYLLQKLARRARRKAEYIRTLKIHCGKKGPGFNSPIELIEYLLRDRNRTDGLLAMRPEVRLEKLDPWHRAFELSISPNANSGKLEFNSSSYNSILGHAFMVWFRSNSGEATFTPFFVWLEGHPCCTGVLTGMEEFDTPSNSVTYQGDAMAMQLVYFSGGVAYCSIDNFSKPFSTLDAPPESKAPQAYAYVWTKDNLLFCAPHLAGSFHHSSFTGGSKIKCAGMIRFINGRVTMVTNDSGHYKPGVEHLRSFVRFLLGQGVLDLTELLIVDKSTHTNFQPQQFYTFLPM